MTECSSEAEEWSRGVNLGIWGSATGNAEGEGSGRSGSDSVGRKKIEEKEEH